MPLWQELLSYALLFGIADKVVQQMQEVYPRLEPEVEQYSQNLSTSYAYSQMMVVNMRQAEERRAQADRTRVVVGFHPWEAVEAQLAVAVVVEQGKEFLKGGTYYGIIFIQEKPLRNLWGGNPADFCQSD